VFADVLRGEEVYPDDPLGRRPDLILVPRAGYTMRRDLHHRVWIDHYRITAGTHRPEGVLIAAGDGIRPGRVAAPVELIDLAPTLLAEAEVAIPEDVDGRVLVELFREPPVATYRPPLDPTDAASTTLSDVEETQVMERLRALGYLA
jgi:predicted AlkP superfamily phosphohydrolase/phosphomutase